MSFGDPNNPYGPPQQPQPGQPPQQPQQPQQPGYGYPTAPQGQPGYHYPQAPPVPQGYGYGAPMQMPGIVQTARVLLFVLAGFQFLAAVIFGILIGAASSSDALDDSGDTAAGVVALVALLMLALGSLSVFLGVKMRNGRGGIRITTMVYASLMILGSVVNIVRGAMATGAGAFGGVISLAFGITILSAMISGGAWFNRPRY
ncbi:hypothetical protein ACFY30_02835 [Streptomyces sp. NPDC000345]|uniref:hypothetical protein n=1 Tax=Streptomyces sp. NPDC000345 TaxID=3364537 RepID=UPI0036C9FA9D